MRSNLQRIILFSLASSMVFTTTACAFLGGSDGSEPSSRETVSELRGATDVPVEADGVDLDISPTTLDGQVLDVDGAQITVPENYTITQGTDAMGWPDTLITNSDSEIGMPAIDVTRVGDFGRSLESETYYQEVTLIGEGNVNTYISRDEVEWPGADEAYVITWVYQRTTADGSTRMEDILEFWVTDGNGGGWTITALAEEGTLTPGSEIWNMVFSFTYTD